MRFRHKPVALEADDLLYAYWGPEGFFRPTVEVLLRGPTNTVVKQVPLLDTGSPFIVFEQSVAEALGLSPPFGRRTTGRAAGGAELSIAFPEDGAVTVFLSDFREGFCAWQPLVGFLGPRQGPPSGLPAKQTAILGITGFFQYFNVTFPDGPDGPGIDIEPKPNFPGLRGAWPAPRNLWARFDRPA
jgi:hypothetical protein